MRPDMPLGAARQLGGRETTLPPQSVMGQFSAAGAAPNAIARDVLNPRSGMRAP